MISTRGLRATVDFPRLIRFFHDAKEKLKIYATNHLLHLPHLHVQDTGSAAKLKELQSVPNLL